MPEPIFNNPLETIKRNPVLSTLWGLWILWTVKSLLFSRHFLAFSIFAGFILLFAAIALKKSKPSGTGQKSYSIKRNVLFIAAGLAVVWVAGIILANIFNVDFDRLVTGINSDFFLWAFVGAAVFIFFLLTIGLFRIGSKKDREELTDDERRSKIILNFSLGVSLPLGLAIPFMFLGANLKNYFDPKYDLYSTVGFGTLLSMTGLPFIIRMLRLIRDELKAVRIAFLLTPYGLALWAACVLLLMMMFMRGGCC